MANLQEVVSWDAGVYQLETNDPVLGGPGGTSNKQAQALANRTAYLKKHMDDLEGGTTAAGKANKLTTARTIAVAGDVTGQASFDGSGNISITATYKNSGVVAGTYRSVTVDAKGNVTAGSNPTTLSGYGITDALPATGTAAAAQKLATARTIALAGDITGQANFDGSGNISITATYKNSGVVAGTYRSVTVDAKGNVTDGSNPTTLSGYGITDAVPSSQKGAANGVATLDSGGKVPVAQIPATAITDTFVVGTQAAMLALTAETGDVAVRTDLNKSFILRVAGASTLANWQELLTPTDSVQSVDGMTGAVVLPSATEGGKGKAQIATQAEVDAGIDDSKFVTALKLMNWVKQAGESVLGMLKVATQAQTNAGAADDVVVTPKKLRAGFAVSLDANGYIAFPTWMGGVIIQWGRFIVNFTTAPQVIAQVVTLPMTFPTSLRTVMLEPFTSSPTQFSEHGFIPTNNSQFTAYVNGKSNIAQEYRWVAIGY